MKVYLVSWSFISDVHNWHQGGSYYNAGMFSTKEKAEELVKKITSMTYEDGRRRYYAHVEEIELDVITDTFIKEKIAEEENKEE